MPKSSSEHRATILLVDDEAMLRGLLTHVLFGAGFAVVEAEHGEQALQQARAFDGQLSLVITDLNMPVMGGFEFARAFRPMCPTVPILFITGNEIRESDLARSLEVSGHLLRKPFRPHQLLETVARMLTPSATLMVGGHPQEGTRAGERLVV